MAIEIVDLTIGHESDCGHDIEYHKSNVAKSNARATSGRPNQEAPLHHSEVPERKDLSSRPPKSHAHDSPPSNFHLRNKKGIESFDDDILPSLRQNQYYVNTWLDKTPGWHNTKLQHQSSREIHNHEGSSANRQEDRSGTVSSVFDGASLASGKAHVTLNAKHKRKRPTCSVADASHSTRLLRHGENKQASDQTPTPPIQRRNASMTPYIPGNPSLISSRRRNVKNSRKDDIRSGLVSSPEHDDALRVMACSDQILSQSRHGRRPSNVITGPACMVNAEAERTLFQNGISSYHGRSDTEFGTSNSQDYGSQSSSKPFSRFLPDPGHTQSGTKPFINTPLMEARGLSDDDLDPHPTPAANSYEVLPTAQLTSSTQQRASQVNNIPSRPSSPTFFAPDFDRGRYPKDRRRRGGKKFGTPRINGFPKKPSQSGTQIQREQPSKADGQTWSEEEVDEVTKFCLSVLGPAIKRQHLRNQYQLPRETLDQLEAGIANSVVGNDLLTFLRNNEFSATKAQISFIRKKISLLYKIRAYAAFGHHTGRQTLPHHVLTMKIPWSDIPTKVAIDPSTEKRINNNSEQQLSVEKDLISRDIVGVQNMSNANKALANLKTLKELYGNSKIPQTSYKHIALLTPEDFRRQISDKSIKHAKSYVNTPYEAAKPLQANEAFAIAPVETRRPSDLEKADFNTIPWRAHNAIATLRSSECDIVSEPAESKKARTSFNHQLEALMAGAALDDQVPAKIDDAQHMITVTGADQQHMQHSDYVAERIVSRGRTKGVMAIQGSIVDPTTTFDRQMTSLLRHRELGFTSRWDISSELRLRVAERVKPWRTWKGASSDIVNVAWAPDSTTYAVGAAAHTNAEDLQYNRPLNLLVGDIATNKLWELPEHRTHRPRPDSIAHGPNASQETYNACDPLVYQTVNAVKFSADGEFLYTASRDKTLKVWDVQDAQKVCIETFDHGEVVTGIDIVHNASLNVFATACQGIENPISIFFGSYSRVYQSREWFSSERAKAKASLRILPECLHWGPAAHNNHILLAGFSQWDQLGDRDSAREGHLCLWDVNQLKSIKVTPSSQSVTAAAWHPLQPVFVTGGAPGGSLAQRHTKTVVRTYDRRLLTRFVAEFESPALDIQDVTYNPRDQNIVTAGCTDGTSFVWDYRRPDTPLHCLLHGKPLLELDPEQARGHTDTGVRLSLWGPEGWHYYTGSSDGVVKAWDIRRHPEDVLVRDVAHIGAAIQDGAFSPDQSQLLVGDADGGIHLLSSAPFSPSGEEGFDIEDSKEESIQLVRAPDGSGKRIDDENPGVEGIEAARELVRSGQVDIHPMFGPGKGKNYIGPFAKDEQRICLEDEDGFSRRTTEVQVFGKDGLVNEEVAACRRAHVAMRKSMLDAGHYQNEGGEEWPEDLQTSFSERVRIVSEEEAIDGLMHARVRALKAAKDTKMGAYLPEHEMVEENYWWPDLGKAEIERAKGGVS